MEKVNCPICLKPFSRPGVIGHMYHVHGLGSKELAVQTREAMKPTPKVRDVAAKIMELTDTLKALRAKRAEAKAMDGGGVFRRDQTVEQILLAYDRAEAVLMDELKALETSRRPAERSEVDELLSS